MHFQSSSLVIIILLMGILSSTDASELEVGSPAPGFELLDQKKYLSSPERLSRQMDCALFLPKR